MSILLTSTSQIKLEAVSQVFPLEVIGRNVPDSTSGCDNSNPAQPFGIDSNGCTAALACAHNRIKIFNSVYTKNATKDAKYIVSIENGIINSSVGILYDICEVVLVNIETGETITTRYFEDHIKVSIPDPAKYLEQIKKVSSSNHALGYDLTFGTLIGKDFSTSKSNWMKTFGVDRLDQIVASLEHIKSLMSENFQLIKDNIRVVPDYPEKGVMFQDMFSLFESHETLDTIVSKMADVCSRMNITKVTGPELRGCMLGALVAKKMSLPFLPIRKPGKLPPPVIQIEYAKEYGVDKLELNSEQFNTDDRVLVVDDILATGGSLKACIDMVEQCSCVAHSIVLADVEPLRNIAKEKMGANTYTVLLK